MEVKPGAGYIDMAQSVDNRVSDLFGLKGKIAIITGGTGLLGVQHSEIIAAAGGNPIIADLNQDAAEKEADRISEKFGVHALGVKCDITSQDDVNSLSDVVMREFSTVDILINNAANNPKIEKGVDSSWSRAENFPLDVWNKDLEVGITGSFICIRTFGKIMADKGSGSIINIASDLAVIAPDQRLYRLDNVSNENQPVKPVTYSVVKTALLGLTRYFATYWPAVRVNAISPGGVYNNQPDEFVKKLKHLIPMDRMANLDEYQGAILFLSSEASSYMTGQNLIVDGGRSCW